MLESILEHKDSGTNCFSIPTPALTDAALHNRAAPVYCDEPE